LDCPDIILVDNQNDSSDLMADALTVKGYAVERAASLDAAMRMIRRCPPRLVIGSISISGENFLAFCRALKKEPDLPGIPVLVILPEQARYEPGYGESYGIVDALVKPVDLSVLVQKARRWVEPPKEPSEGRETGATALPPQDPELPFGEPEEPAPVGPPAEETPAGRREAVQEAGPFREDPAEKLARDLERAAGLKRRNRLFAAAVTASALLLLLSFFFFSGGPEPVGRPEGESAPGSGEEQAPAGLEPSGDPFGGMIRSDLAREEEGAGRTGAAEEAPPPEGPVYLVQVGAFRVQGNAERLADRLRGKGYLVRIVERPQGGGVLHRVLVEGFGSRDEALSARDRIARSEGLKGILVRR